VNTIGDTAANRHAFAFDLLIFCSLSPSKTGGDTNCWFFKNNSKEDILLSLLTITFIVTTVTNS